MEIFSFSKMTHSLDMEWEENIGRALFRKMSRGDKIKDQESWEAHNILHEKQLL